MQDDIKDMAISHAVSDIGLTPDEAEDAYYNYFPTSDIINPCMDCGVEVDNLDNEICDTCWNKFNKTLEQAKKNWKQV